MIIHTPMRIEETSVTLAQWFSPSFPVGAFAYSHGLEWAIQTRAVCSATTLQAWLTDVLEYGAGWSDLVLLTAAYRAHACDLDYIDATARAFCASSERLMETDLQGAAFVKTTQSVWGYELPALTYPVAVGRAAQLAGFPLSLVLPMFLHGVVSNLVSAAVRLVPLGQTDGQQTLTALAPLVHTLSDRAQGSSLDDLTSCAFLSDIAAMQHETQSTRIFRS